MEKYLLTTKSRLFVVIMALLAVYMVIYANFAIGSLLVAGVSGYLLYKRWKKYPVPHYSFWETGLEFIYTFLLFSMLPVQLETSRKIFQISYMFLLFFLLVEFISWIISKMKKPIKKTGSKF